MVFYLPDIMFSTYFTTLQHPNGRNGGEAHQEGMEAAETELREAGFDKIENEVMVRTPGGTKEKRFIDVQGTNTSTGEVRQIQVGKQNKNGSPVSRERKAMDDVGNATGVRPEFKPYNYQFPILNLITN